MASSEQRHSSGQDRDRNRRHRRHSRRSGDSNQAHGSHSGHATYSHYAQHTGNEYIGDNYTDEHHQGVEYYDYSSYDVDHQAYDPSNNGHIYETSKKSRGDTAPQGESNWRWQCCSCGKENNSYNYDIGCPHCHNHSRCGSCSVSQ